MKLPLTIFPCPISEVVLDVRFETSLPPDAVFGVVYQALKETFPKSTALPITSIPAEVRNKNPQLSKQFTHHLDGEDQRIFLGSGGFAVAVKTPYPGWETVEKGFRETLSRVAKTGAIKKPTRLSLRFISFFKGDIFPKLTLAVSINDLPVDGMGTLLKTILFDQDCRLLLQVSKDVKINRKNLIPSENEPVKQTPPESGSVIDIESIANKLETDRDFDEVLADFLERAHRAEKALFFRLLKEDFLATLNPTYSE